MPSTLAALSPQRNAPGCPWGPQPGAVARACTVSLPMASSCCPCVHSQPSLGQLLLPVRAQSAFHAKSCLCTSLHTIAFTQGPVVSCQTVRTATPGAACSQSADPCSAWEAPAARRVHHPQPLRRHSQVSAQAPVLGACMVAQLPRLHSPYLTPCLSLSCRCTLGCSTPRPAPAWWPSCRRWACTPTETPHHPSRGPPRTHTSPMQSAWPQRMRLIVPGPRAWSQAPPAAASRARFPGSADLSWAICQAFFHLYRLPPTARALTTLDIS